MLLYNQFYWDLQETFRFSCKSQFFFVLLQLSCCGWLAMSRRLSKNPWLGLSLLRKTFSTFSSDLLKSGKLQKVFRGRQQWASTHCVYTHGIGVPFPFVWIGYILCYYICKFGVGFCCFLSLVYKVFLGPRKARVMRVIDSLRHFCFGSNYTN